MAISFDGTTSKAVFDPTGLDITTDYAINLKMRLTDLTAAFTRNISLRDGGQGFQIVQEDDKLFIFGDGGSSTAWGRDADASTGNTNTVLENLSVDTWYNISINFAVGATYTVPTVWLDGVAVTNDGDSTFGGSAAGYNSGTDTGLFHMGARSATGSSVSAAGDCILAEVTIWDDAVLDIDDAIAFTAGNSADAYHVPDLAHHLPGVTATETPESGGGETVTYYGSPTTFTHPTMISANEMTATAAMSFGSSAALKGTGKLTAASAITFSSAASLTTAANEDMTAAASLAFGSSAVLNATGKLTAVTALSLTTSADLTSPLVMESDDFDSALVSSIVVTDANTLTPTVTLTPDDQSDVPGWLMLCARSASGSSGRTPNFVYDDVDCRFTGVQDPCWRYLTDDRNTWYAFDNVNTVGTIVTASMNTPFTGEIEFATKPRWHYSDTQDWIAEIALDEDAHELASSVAAGSLPTNVHAIVDPGATNANSFPQQDINLYGIRISNDAASPTIGSKWPVVLLTGTHASEDQGDYMCQAFVDYLLSGTTLADRLLVDFDFYIYNVNPAGRAYGKERWVENDTTNSDPNRAWDGVPSGTVVDDIIAAIGTDVTDMKAMIDFHGNFQATANFGAFYDSSNVYDVSFKTKMATKLTSYPHYGDNVAGTSGEWALNDGALFAPTPEAKYYPDGHPTIATMYDGQGLALAETLDEMRMEIEASITATSAISIGSSAVLNATGKLTAAASMAFSSSASLAAAADVDMTASASMAFSSVVALNAIGKLTAAAGMSFGTSAALNGVGSLQASSAMSFGSVAELNAIGNLLSSSSITFSTGAELTVAGGNSLTASASMSFGSLATFNATGKLTAATGLNFTNSAVLNATGGLTAVANVVFGSSAELTAASLNELRATAGISFGSAALLNATGKLTATTSLAMSTTALLVAPGVAPAVPGMEYTMGGSKVHFTMNGNPLHYTLN